MKLVKIDNYTGRYINMDYVVEIYKSVTKAEEYFIRTLDNFSYKISEKAYNTILNYGKANL